MTKHSEHDHARADDDGMGLAIGASQAPEDDAATDLGAEWNKPIDSISSAYEAAKATTGNIYYRASGNFMEALPATIETAKKMLDECGAEPLTQRFILLQFEVEGTDPETMQGGQLQGTVTTVGTIGKQALLTYAEQVAMEQFFSDMLKADAKASSANELEV